MAKRSQRHFDDMSPEAQQHTLENLALGQMHRLQTMLQQSGHYDFQQRVRELEEQFRSKTGRKEKTDG